MKCIFCNNKIIGNKSREHILPLWLLKEFGFKDDLVFPTHYNEQGEVISQRNQTLNKFVEGHICSKCNNGWMSKLETDNIELIKDLALSKTNILKISDKQAIKLAQWTYKTALCLHSASNYRKI